MKNLDAMGITDYYDQLPFGDKDAFIREVADAIGKSSQSVRRKIRLGCWSKPEMPLVNDVINGRG